MKRWFVAICVLLGLSVCAWVVLSRGNVIERFRDERSPATTVGTSSGGVRGLLVEPDDGRSPLTEEIDSARRSIDVMVYILSDAPIVQALIDAEARGVTVRAILEQHPYGGFGNPEEVVAKLESAGAEVKWSSSEFTFTHAKTLIIDQNVVAILNLNLTRSAFDNNREFGVISTVPTDVATASGIFEADWLGHDWDGGGSLVVSPVNSRESIVGLIDGAAETIEIYAEVMRDDVIVDRLIAAENRGVEVRILLSPDDDPVWGRIKGELFLAGVELRMSSDLYIHAKAVIVDNVRAYVGSQNFTQTSLDKNREIGIIVVEPAALSRLASIFAADFAAATVVD